MEMEIEKLKETEEGVRKWDGTIFCSKEKLITMDMKGFDCNDARITTLVDGFCKKAKELGFKAEDVTDESVWNYGTCSVWLSSY